MNEIYDRYWEKLIAIAYNHLKDMDEASEVVQELLVKLWDKREQIQLRTLEGYLATAIKYNIYNRLARTRRKKEIAETVGQIYTPFQVDEDFIFGRFLSEYLNEAIEKLPEKCRLVFLYSRFEGKNNKEISETMHISEKTVEAHLTNALKKLRRLLGSMRYLFIL